MRQQRGTVGLLHLRPATSGCGRLLRDARRLRLTLLCDIPGRGLRGFSLPLGNRSRTFWGMGLRRKIRFLVPVRRSHAPIPLMFAIALSGVAVAVFNPRDPKRGQAGKEVLVHREAAGTAARVGRLARSIAAIDADSSTVSGVDCRGDGSVSAERGPTPEVTAVVNGRRITSLRACRRYADGKPRPSGLVTA